ncbi:hypothetical protein BpHYR1_012194 [Brachionus plicatilis]|uniref:Uncharacterized protein n=1 Tax=Brachionus plicatilis TaxID=10195 RepID=A0A3M7Q6D7_BRAPC|nr:hypothetical protein BpHYR1_012194 [Brachionus plicatilis]
MEHFFKIQINPRKNFKFFFSKKSPIPGFKILYTEEEFSKSIKSILRYLFIVLIPDTVKLIF